MTQHKRPPAQNPALRTIARISNSITKRLFWKRHLAEAQNKLESLRGELPTNEMLITVPLIFSGKGHYRSMELKQNMTELLGLVKVLEQRPLRHVCEIGTFKGGTLFVWCQLALEDANIYSIDLPGGAFGGGYNERSTPFFQSFRKPGQKLECLRGNSHELSMRNKFKDLLGGDKLDFLFIDGDHSYAGVKQDFEDYAPFVKSGGIIAFHDIVERPVQPDIEVWRFWQELKHDYRCEEFIEQGPDRRKIGIGLLYKD